MSQIEQIDIVIPTCPKDIETLPYVINGVRKNIIGCGKIYIICSKELEKYTEGCIFINERSFPFSPETVIACVKEKIYYGKNPLWYYQQLLKLYAHRVIEGLSSSHLIVDSETIFYNLYNPLENGKATYTTSSEVNVNYRKHMKLLLPEIKIYSPVKSGICHQMLFQRAILEDLFEKVLKSFKQKFGYVLPFWKIMLFFSTNFTNTIIDYSEYDLYYNFIWTFYSDKIQESDKITWDITSKILEKSDYTYLTAHAHLR